VEVDAQELERWNDDGNLGEGAFPAHFVVLWSGETFVKRYKTKNCW